MVSIIISTYNRSERLKRAIQSVVDQTYKDWELIVVDDFSTDDTQKVIKSFTKKDQRIKGIRECQNFGTDTHPKNVGILASKGDYIAFLDDDNDYLPDHLMILTKEAEKRPDVDVIYGDRLIIFDDEKRDPQIGICSDFDAGLLMERNYIDTSDVLIKREALFTVGGFDERYKKYVDWNLWIRMMKAQMKFHHVAKVITNYHIHSDMKSTRVKDHAGETPYGNLIPQRIFKPQWDGFELEIQLPYLGEVKPPKIAIFTLTKDRLEYTKVMFDSLKKAGYPFTWFVIDQGSTDGTVEWLKTLPKTKSITYKFTFNETNKGISLGSNQALDLIGDKYDYILKIDNDCEVYSDKWLSKLLYIFMAHWQICLSPYVEGLIDNPGGTPRLGYKNLRGHLLGMTNHIGGIFVMTHKSVYKDFRWPTDDFLHGMQDVVFSQEAQKRGFLVGYVEDMRVGHIDTTQGQKEKYPDYFKKRIYERTHTFK